MQELIPEKSGKCLVPKVKTRLEHSRRKCRSRKHSKKRREKFLWLRQNKKKKKKEEMKALMNQLCSLAVNSTRKASVVAIDSLVTRFVEGLWI
jgi:hypothetical protein